MCGIVGLIGENSKEYIDQAIDLMGHRGPDGAGVFIAENMAMGHKRLAIQDLSQSASQPMHSADGNYTIIFNGEIYNHAEIRSSLINKYPFHSTGDTETLLYGYIEYGEELLNMLNGIFAFAVFNHSSKEIFIARDHFGVKPLYYYIEGDKFYFASEMKSFLADPALNKEIAYNSLVNYTSLLWSPGELTPFLKVKKLLPGHYIKLIVTNPKQYQVRKYYDIPFNGNRLKRTENEILDLLDEKLYKAVERQLLSDVPVGFFLSGGLDSSAIVAMAKRIRPNERLRCYTIKTDFESEESEGIGSDLEYARKLADKWNLDLVEVEADAGILQEFDKMIFHLDEPQADLAALNVLNICRRANLDGYKVLLGGTAGDDLFTGYRRHQAIILEKYIRLLPVAIRQFASKKIMAVKSNSTSSRRIKKIAQNIAKSKNERLYSYFEWLDNESVMNLFTDSAKARIQNYLPSDYFMSLLNNISEEKSDINKSLYWELKTFLVDHNLNYTDKLSMAAGVEVRVPFLDKELVEFSTTIPVHLKMKGKTTKYILKKVMERYMPKDIIYRPKVGFGVPLRKWILNDMNTLVEDYLSAESIKKRGVFNPIQVEALLNKNKSGQIDGSYIVLALMAFESWSRQFIDN